MAHANGQSACGQQGGATAELEASAKPFPHYLRWLTIESLGPKHLTVNLSTTDRCGIGKQSATTAESTDLFLHTAMPQTSDTLVDGFLNPSKQVEDI